MKKYLYILSTSLLVLVFARAVAKNSPVSSADDPLAEYLHKHFGSRQYCVLKESLVLDGHKMVFAVSYVDSKRKIFDRGVGVVVESSKAVPYVYFEKNKVMNGNRKSVIDVSSFNYNYYGWMFEFPRKAPKKPNYYHIAYWRDGGSSTADSITVEWNSKKRTFEARHYEND